MKLELMRSNWINTDIRASDNKEFLAQKLKVYTYIGNDWFRIPNS